MIGRRVFLSSLVLGWLALPRFGGFLAPALAGTANPGEKETGREGQGFDPALLFAGKRYNYDVRFWWFNPAGRIYLSFQEREGGGYLALAGGQTTGFVGALTRRMTFAYRSFMTYDQELKRLVSQRFEEESIQGRRAYRSVRIFDHAQRRIRYLKPRRHLPPKEKLIEIEGPKTVDHLTAFFNWRAGVYGPPSRGRIYRIPTMPSHGNKETVVHFRSEAEAEERRRIEQVDLPNLLDVQLDKRIILSKTGRILGWADNSFVPNLFTILDVMVVGTVRARLTGEEKIPLRTGLGPLFPSERIVSEEGQV